MSLGRYLTISFMLITVLFYALYIPAHATIVAEYGPEFSTTPLLVMTPILTGFFTFIASTPLARKVPFEDRNSFWSYKEANRPIWMMAAIASFGWLSYLLDL